MEIVDLIAYLLVATKLMIIIVCLIFLISGIDDVFIDICYVVRAVYRRIFIIPPSTDASAKETSSITRNNSWPSWCQLGMSQP